jgi:hypothetical protein
MAGSMAFAGTALTKESYLVFAVAAAAWLAVAVGRRRRVRAAAQAAAVLLPGMLALGLWWAYVACRLPAGAGDRRGVAALGPPLAGWEHAIGLVVKGQYVPDAQVGPLVAALLVGSGLLAVAAILPGTRRPTLLGWTGLLLGLYGLVLSGLLLEHARPGPHGARRRPCHRGRRDHPHRRKPAHQGPRTTPPTDPARPLATPSTRRHPNTAAPVDIGASTG